MYSKSYQNVPYFPTEALTTNSQPIMLIHELFYPWLLGELVFLESCYMHVQYNFLLSIKMKLN